jgi:hypothetical protein
LQKSWHGHLAREKRLFSWQIPAMNHGQDARATLFASPSFSLTFSLLVPIGGASQKENGGKKPRVRLKVWTPNLENLSERTRSRTIVAWRSEAATKKTEPQMHTDSH